MRVLTCRLRTFLLLLLQGLWLVVEVPVDRLAKLLQDAVDAAEIAEIVANVEAAIAAKRKAQALAKGQGIGDAYRGPF